jgi:sec-independent protein translocase protein TatA
VGYFQSREVTMIQGPQLIIVLAIILLLFGGSKLPKLARSLGEAQKEFREGLKEGEEDGKAPAASAKTDGRSDANPTIAPAPTPPNPTVTDSPTGTTDPADG